MIEMGKYKFKNYPFTYKAYVSRRTNAIVLVMNLSLFTIQLTKEEFDGALFFGDLDRIDMK